MASFTFQYPTEQMQHTVRRKEERVTGACENCRSFRTKCSGEEPTCSSCIDKGFTCIYSPSAKLIRSQRDLKTVKGRCQQLENLFAENFDTYQHNIQALQRALQDIRLGLQDIWRDSPGFQKVGGHQEGLVDKKSKEISSKQLWDHLCGTSKIRAGKNHTLSRIDGTALSIITDSDGKCLFEEMWTEERS